MGTTFTIHTLATAPQDSRKSIEGAQKAFGLVPNLIGLLAESPAAVQGYLTLAGLFSAGSFDAIEQHVILQAVNVANDCHYCTAAHSAIAGMQKLPAEIDRALLQARPLADTRLETLRRFTAAVVAERGWVKSEEVAGFLGAGYSKAQLLELVMAVGFKTFSNYVNHIASTPVDEAFRPFVLAKAS